MTDLTTRLCDEKLHQMTIRVLVRRAIQKDHIELGSNGVLISIE